MIKEFQGQYRWLSNFWSCPIDWKGEVYPSVEHAYQASKFTSPDARRVIRQASTPGMAKRFGKNIKNYERVPEKYWDGIKLDVMLELVRRKFAIPEFKKLLLATGNQELQEGNRWGDTFWGVDLRTGKGENHLGKIIMRVREELKR